MFLLYATYKQRPTLAIEWPETPLLLKLVVAEITHSLHAKPSSFTVSNDEAILPESGFTKALASIFLSEANASSLDVPTGTRDASSLFQ